MSAYLSDTPDLGLTALSYGLAALAAFAAVDLAQRDFLDPRHERLWLTLGAFAVGGCLWAMHFVGLHALSLPIAIGYGLGKTLLSLIAAIGASAMVLYVASRDKLDIASLVVGSVVIGLGFCVMLYVGVWAMDMQPGIDWQRPLLVTAIASAMVVAAATLWALFYLRTIPASYRLPVRVLAALVIAAAVVGVHQTGLAAARFPLSSVSGTVVSLTDAWSVGSVASAMGLFTALVMALATYDARHLRRQHEDHMRREQEQRAHMLALHDPDTMLRNRASFQQEAINYIHRCGRSHVRFDLFYGSLRVDGDETQAIKVVAGRLRQLARPHDFLARYGRSEFALLRIRDPMEGAPQLLRDQLLAACTMPMDIDGRRVTPQAHVGVGTFPDDGQTPRQLLMAAARSANPADTPAVDRRQHTRSAAA